MLDGRNNETLFAWNLFPRGVKLYCFCRPNASKDRFTIYSKQSHYNHSFLTQKLSKRALFNGHWVVSVSSIVFFIFHR